MNAELDHDVADAEPAVKSQPAPVSQESEAAPPQTTSQTDRTVPDNEQPVEPPGRKEPSPQKPPASSRNISASRVTTRGFVGGARSAGSAAGKSASASQLMAHGANLAKKDGGSLLRLFQSECFDSYFHMFYLFHRREQGVHDYLVNLLYRRPDVEIHYYLPQLCQLAIVRSNTSSSLPRFLLDKAAKSMHMALKASWFFQSTVDDRLAGLVEPASKLVQEIEMAVVNSKAFPGRDTPEGLYPGALGTGDLATAPIRKQKTPDLFQRRRLVRMLLKRGKCNHYECAHVAAMKLCDRFERQTPAGKSEETVPETSPAKEQKPDSITSESVDDRTITAQPVLPSEPQEGLESPEQPVSTSPIHPKEPTPSAAPAQKLSTHISTKTTASSDTESRMVSASEAGINKRKRASDLPFLTSAGRASVSSSSGAKGQKGRIARGFVSVTTLVQIESSKVKLPSVYSKLSSPLNYTSFTRESQSFLRDNGEMQQYIIKQRRCDYFNTVNLFVQLVIEVSEKLILEPDKNLRNPLMRAFFVLLNEWMLCRRCIVAASEGIFAMTGLALPMSHFGPDPEHQTMHPTVSMPGMGPFDSESLQSQFSSVQIIRISPEECRVFSSRKRAPYLLVFEMADLDEDLRAFPSLSTSKRLRMFSYHQKTFDGSKSDLESHSHSEEETAEQMLSTRGKKSYAKLAWRCLYVFDAVLRDLKQKGLYIPPFCSRPLTPYELSVIEHPEARTISCDECMSEVEGMMISGSRSLALEGSISIGPDSLSTMASPPMGISMSLARTDHADSCLTGLAEDALMHSPNPDAARPSEPFAESERSTKSGFQIHPDFPFACPKCMGTKLYYRAIVEEIPLDSLRRSLGISAVTRRQAPPPGGMVPPKQAPGAPCGSAPPPSLSPALEPSSNPSGAEMGSFAEYGSSSLIDQSATAAQAQKALPKISPEFLALSRTLPAILCCPPVWDGAPKALEARKDALHKQAFTVASPGKEAGSNLPSSVSTPAINTVPEEISKGTGLTASGHKAGSAAGFFSGLVFNPTTQRKGSPAPIAATGSTSTSSTATGSTATGSSANRKRNSKDRKPYAEARRASMSGIGLSDDGSKDQDVDKIERSISTLSEHQSAPQVSEPTSTAPVGGKPTTKPKPSSSTSSYSIVGAINAAVVKPTTNLLTGGGRAPSPSALVAPSGEGLLPPDEDSLPRSAPGAPTPGLPELAAPLKLPGETPAAQAARVRKVIWGELWSERTEKIRASSPYGGLRSWRLGAVMVKGGDDVRQELLASQLVWQFKTIFSDAHLPLMLSPYEILVTGCHSGIMDFVPDTCSVDAIKRKFNIDSVAKAFEAAFADNPHVARRNFIQSHAAYSLVGYFLQVKDRHNGNLLLDAEGRMVHIDYGFMLANSPGSVNFETSPFKLSPEIMAIMEGEHSEHFEYFRQLILKGFLEARKFSDRVVLVVEMMLSASKMPCFGTSPENTLQALKDRFMLGTTDDVCVARVTELIDLSVNNWRTTQYDTFQRLTNGIF